MSNEIGDDWSELFDRLTEVLDFEPLLSDNEQDFVEGLHNRLKTYKGRTYVSTKQLNWLELIEAKIRKGKELI